MSKRTLKRCSQLMAFALASAPVLTQAQAPAAPPPQLAAQYTQAGTPVALTQYSERVAKARPVVPFQVLANLSAGGNFTGGNTKAYAAMIGGRFMLLQQPHQLTIDGQFTWSAAVNPALASDDPQTTALNVIGKARYDRFLSKADALFVAIGPRRDRFAGLDIRLQMQAGYLRNLYVPADNHKLWGEVGYDGTYDNFTPWQPKGKAPDPMAPELPPDDFVNSGRAFLGYTNALTAMASINLGVEVLIDFEFPGDNTRVNTNAELVSSLSQRFKLSLSSRILYDQQPVPGKEKTDFITAAQLVYTYDSLGAPPACAVCDCTGEVKKAKESCNLPLPSNAPLASEPVVPSEPSAAPAANPDAPPAPAAALPSAPAEPVGSTAVAAPAATAPATPAAAVPAPAKPATPAATPR